MSEQLPEPMLASEFAEDFIARVDETLVGDQVGLATMQIAAQVEKEESVVFSVLESMVRAKERGVDVGLYLDTRYANRMTRVGNRDFPDALPILTASHREERQQTKERTANWFEELGLNEILISKSPRPFERGYTPRLRQMGSFHIAQRYLAVVHSKAAWVSKSPTDTTAWVNTGNLTDSDLLPPTPEARFGMNNLLLRLQGRPASFVMEAAGVGYSGGSGRHYYEEGPLKVVHDTGNSGAPGRYSKIFEEVLTAIDPSLVEKVEDPYDRKEKRPQTVVVLSQYAPNGTLALALDNAARLGAYVSSPLEPVTDHRSKSFPYNVNNALFGMRAIGKNMERRTLPSHSKAAIISYENATAQIIVGTDNFVTNLQKALRNEELAVSIRLDRKDEVQGTYYQSFIELLKSSGEISDAAADSLVQL